MNNIRLHAALVPAIVVILSTMVAFLFPHSNAANIMTVFCLGALGGTTSTYYRLKDLPKEEKHNIDAIVQVYTTPIVAGIFSFVLFIALVSGIVDGSLFPDFRFTVKSNSFLQVLGGAAPKENEDAAKLLLWSFTSGFVERIVPNMIDRLGKESAKRRNPPA